MKANKNGEINFKISEKLLPGFSNVQEKRFVSIIGLAKNNKVAFVRIQEKNRSWELPGGAILEEESIIKAAEREFYEETGMKLNYATKTLTIRNMYENVDEVHSLVYVVVGLVDEDIKAETIVDDEIAECIFFDSAPDECTFGQSYYNELINCAISRFSIEKNHEMWSKAANSYDDQTFISENDVHYGPLIPGDSQLGLLPNLSGKYVLDLGCGAGNNLISLKNNGAKGGVGIDFCEEQINHAKEKNITTFDLIIGDINDPSLVRKEKFDVVISVFAISFIENLDNFFDIIKQNLKPGGCVIISTDHPNRKISDSYITERNNSRLRYWNIPNQTAVPYVHYLHSFDEIYKTIKKAGLTVDEVFEPKVLPIDEIDKAPYRSPYYISRYKEMLEVPYTIIFKAHKPS